MRLNWESTLWKVSLGLGLAATFVVQAAMAEENSIARSLGLKESQVGQALDQGPGMSFTEFQRAGAYVGEANDSVFLKNAPGRMPPQKADPLAPKEASLRGMAPRGNSEREGAQNEAIRQLEFRQSVEAAMTKILAFSPTAPRPVENPEPEMAPEVQASYEEMSPQQKLIFAGAGVASYPPPRRPAARPSAPASELEREAEEMALAFDDRAAPAPAAPAPGRVRVFADNQDQEDNPVVRVKPVRSETQLEWGNFSPHHRK